MRLAGAEGLVPLSKCPPILPLTTASCDDPPSTRQVEDVSYPHRKALAALVRGGGKCSRRTGIISRRSSRDNSCALNGPLLAVSRRPKNESLFERTPRVHKSGGSFCYQLPRYLRALSTRNAASLRMRTSKCATRDSPTRTHANEGVGAMLDAPVFVRGAMVGVVCHEHMSGVRLRWEVAGSIPIFVASRSISRARRGTFQNSRRAPRLARRCCTAELTLVNENLQREIANRKRTEALLRHSENNLKTL